MSELMFKPEYGRLRAFESMSTRLVRSRNHHDGDAKMARRFDLWVGRRPARVFGDEHFDLLAREKRRFRFSVEGTTIVKQPDIWRQRDVTRRIDGAGDVVMMGRARESPELKGAKGGKKRRGPSVRKTRRGFGPSASAAASALATASQLLLGWGSQAGRTIEASGIASRAQAATALA